MPIAHSLAGANPLLDEAASLLALGGYLRGAERPDDLDQLRIEIIDAVLAYRERLATHYPPSIIDEASFCLCAFLDDCVLRTLWGRDASTQWSGQSVLAEVHKTTHLSRLTSKIRAQLQQGQLEHDLLSLYHTVLSLGFSAEGDGEAMGLLASDTYRELQRSVPQEASLSAEGAVAVDTGENLERRLPPWVPLAITAALLTSMFVGLQYLLQPTRAQYEDRLAALTVAQGRLGVKDFFPNDGLPPPRLDLFRLLAPQIERGEVQLFMDDVRGTRIVLSATQMFESGSANLASDVQPLLGAVAHALREADGAVIVEGHSDSIGSAARNETLSRQRAEQVVAVFGANALQPERLRARGVADRRPRECNDTPSGRAANRRVEILLPAVDTADAPLQQPPACQAGDA
ncbi:MAG: DotU/TssL family secretion system protein [Pseudomonadota bacterium]